MFQVVIVTDTQEPTLWQPRHLDVPSLGPLFNGSEQFFNMSGLNLNGTTILYAPNTTLVDMFARGIETALESHGFFCKLTVYKCIHTHGCLFIEREPVCIELSKKMQSCLPVQKPLKQVKDVTDKASCALDCSIITKNRQVVLTAGS